MKKEKESERRIRKKQLQKVPREAKLHQPKAAKVLHHPKELQHPKRMQKAQKLSIQRLKTMSTTTSRNFWTILQAQERSPSIQEEPPNQEREKMMRRPRSSRSSKTPKLLNLRASKRLALSVIT